MSISGGTKIKEKTYIAPKSTIRNKITIEKESFIGLGMVVVKDVKEAFLFMK